MKKAISMKFYDTEPDELFDKIYRCVSLRVIQSSSSYKGQSKLLSGSQRDITKNFIVILIALLFMSLSTLTFAQNTDYLQEFLDGNHTTFSTQNHPKAKGVHLKIDYPNSWVAQEGEHPNIVQKFVSEGGRGLEIITLGISLLPEDIAFTEDNLKELITPTEMKGMLPEGAKFIDAKPTKIEGLPAGILEYSMRAERAGMIIDTQNISYIFIYKTTIVQLGCMVSVVSPSEEDLSHRMITFKPLFTQIANSIVIPDKWAAVPDVPNGTPPSSSFFSYPKEGFSLIVLALVVSLVITWGVGLTPPLLIRYVFLRRPLSKKTASWIAVGFSFFFWIAFSYYSYSIGVSRGTGFVWIIMFFVARWILSR